MTCQPYRVDPLLFLSLPSGVGEGKEESPTPKPHTHAHPNTWRSKTSPDLDSKEGEEGGAFEDPTPRRSRRNTFSVLRTRLGPAGGERERREGKEEGKGSHTIAPSLNPCSPALVSIHRCIPSHPPGARGGEWKRMGERTRNVWREEFALMLEKMEGGVCLRVSGGCRGNAKARGVRVQFIFVSVVACCSGYRRRDVHYADLLYFYTTSSTTL